MSNQNDLVIVRRGDVEALKQEAIFGVFRRDAVEWDKLNALLANAPAIEQGEAVAWRYKLKINSEWLYITKYPTGCEDSCPVIVEPLYTAPSVAQGEFGISFMKYTEFGVVPDDYKNQAGGYRAGWNDCIASLKYTITTPQQAQSVADALEEAAKICDDNLISWADNEWNDALEEAAKRIRALIKRNAVKEGE